MSKSHLCSPSLTNISTLNRNIDVMITNLKFQQQEHESEIKSKDEKKYHLMMKREY